jgi:hypothetical protein
MQPRCAVCGGETIEIRAKLICRGCGTILETCCEGGPMGLGERACPPGAGDPAADDGSRERSGEAGGGEEASSGGRR